MIPNEPFPMMSRESYRSRNAEVMTEFFEDGGYKGVQLRALIAVENGYPLWNFSSHVTALTMDWKNIIM